MPTNLNHADPASTPPLHDSTTAAVDRANVWFKRGLDGALITVAATIVLGVILTGTGHGTLAGHVATTGVVITLAWLCATLALGFRVVIRATAHDSNLRRERALSGPDLFTLLVFGLYTVHASTADGFWQNGHNRTWLVILAVPALCVLLMWALRGVHAYGAATRTLMRAGRRADVIAAVGTPSSLLSILVAQDVLVEVLGLDGLSWSGFFRVLLVLSSAAAVYGLASWRGRRR